MHPVIRKSLYKLRQPRVAVVVTAALLVVVTILDYVTGPVLNLSIAYFLPITYAAWALGRWPAITTAIIAEIPAYHDELFLVATTREGSLVSVVSTGIVRFLVYVFVAEVTFRLMRSTSQNARTARELQVAYGKLDEDLKAAGLLQASILAFTPPAVPGCDVGAQVSYAGSTGGDFADSGVVDDRIYVCLADISGHGTPSALFTTLLKHLLQDAHRRGLRGADVVSSINAALCLNMPSERFVTLFYTEIEPASGKADYINAGHPEGLIYRRGDGRIECAGPTAPLVGVCGLGGSFPSVETVLYRGDLLVLYTDGAVEAKTLEGDRLGDDLLRDMVVQHSHLPAQEIAARISTTIETRSAPGYRDDMTILVVKKG